MYAAGAKFEKGELPNSLAERLTGLNENLYIHDKFILIDPLGDDPTTVTGSANLSGASQSSNDENMLVIRSDRRVADVYFGEFMRLFDHLYALPPAGLELGDRSPRYRAQVPPAAVFPRRVADMSRYPCGSAPIPD